MECNMLKYDTNDEVNTVEVLICSICRKSFISYKEVAYHMKFSHQIGSKQKREIKNAEQKKQVRQYSRVYKCHNCNYKTKYLTTFNRHKLLHEKKLTVNKCPFCSYTTIQSYNLQRHMRNLHPNDRDETVTFVFIKGFTMPKPVPKDCDTIAKYIIK